MTQTVFQRYEKKYLMEEPLYTAFREALSPFMEEDIYGLTTVCSLYLDTEDDLLIRRSLNSPLYKEKFRLRSYGIPGMDSHVFLEIKKKYDRVVSKRRTELTLEEAYGWLYEGVRPGEESQIRKEIDFFLARYPLKKRLFLAYDRVALAGREDPEFRVTFDRGIRSRRIDPGPEKGDHGQALLPPGLVLMETKILGAVPLWFSDLLAFFRIYPVSFSKYGNVYRREHGAFDPETVLDRVRRGRESLPEGDDRMRRKKIC